jgi:hypothetical protein
MTLLTAMMGGGTSGGGGGGGDSSIGDIKQVMTGNVRQVLQSNTITDSGGGTWIRAGQVYQQSSYPQLFSRIGYVNATVGLTKTTQYGGLIGGQSVAYSPDDDLYVFGLWGPSGGYNAGSIMLANSSMQNFVYKSVAATNYTYRIAYGGDGGNGRFILATNVGVYPFYPSNQTIGSVVSIGDQLGIIAANANTFLAWNSSGGGMQISRTSGATWSAVLSNTGYTAVPSDVVWGNVGGANGSYILAATPAWVETSTDGVSWTGIQTAVANRVQNKFALGTANIYLASFYDASGSNTYAPEVYSSTDGRYWQYRGVAATANSNSAFGAGAVRVTAIANGANTMIAKTDFFQIVTDTSYSYPTYTYGCFHHHNDSHHHHTHDCHVTFAGYATAYNRAYSNTKYNRIYTANAAVTNTTGSNLFAVSNAAPFAHNSHIINAIAYGYTNTANFYLYGTDAGAAATSQDGLNWTVVGTVASGQGINTIVYGTANSTNTFILAGTSGTIRTTTDANINTYVTRTTAYALDTPGWGYSAYGNANGTLTYMLGGVSGNLIISRNGIQFSGMNTLANVNGVAFGANKFVAALPNGVAKWSNDGIFWSNTGAIGGSANDIYAVGSDNTTFVYAGQGGRVGYSYDVAGAWTNASITTSNDHYSITYGGGLWVMGGKSGSMFTSTDGITWTYRNPNTNNTILTVNYLNNTYLYGGDNVLATSTDAVTWIRRTPDPNTNYVRISSLAYGNGYYVYGGQGVHGRSTDGITWTQSIIKPLANSQWGWTTDSANTTYTGQVTDTMYSNTSNVFISVGMAGFAATSPDGNTWTWQNTKTDTNFSGMAFGNGRFLAVGSNGVAKISPNGVLWSGHASNANVFSIAYYGNTTNSFILVGAARYGNTMNANVSYSNVNFGNTNLSYVLETSNDGIYWTTRKWQTPLPPGFAVGGNTTAAIMDINYSLAYSNTLLAIGTQYSNVNVRYYYNTWTSLHNSHARISVSNNLIDWSGLGLGSAFGNTSRTAPVGTGVVPAISFANGRFIAAANAGQIAVSNDGIYWTTTNVYNQFGNTNMYAMANTYFFNYFVGYATYYAQYTWYSALGFIYGYGQYNTPAYYTWTDYPGNYNAYAYQGMSLITYLPGTYKVRYHAASGMYIMPGNIVNFTSKDLVTWTPRASFLVNEATGPVVIGNGTGTNLQYANNANTYSSGMYDASTEFYVPLIFPYTLNYSAQNQTNTTTPTTQQPSLPMNSQVQLQSTGENVDLVWYVKAKTS